MRLAAQLIVSALLLFSIKGTAQVTCNLSLLATPAGASCSSACDGSVVLTPVGGTAPYTFNAFEHTFPGSAVDLSVFDIRNGSFSVANNQLTAAPNVAVATNYDNSIATKTLFPDNGKLVVEASFYIDYNTYGNFGLAEDAVITDATQIPYAFFFNYGTLYASIEGNLIEVGNYSSSTWYDFKIEKLGSTVNFYMRNTGLSSYTLVASETATLTNPGYKLAATYYNFYNYYGGYRTSNWRVGGNPPTSGLCPGTYSYTVFDANGCFASASVTIGTATGPGTLQLNANATPASCTAASDGEIALMPTGGTGPYTFGFAHVFQGGSINENIFELRNGNFSQGTDLREGNNYNSNNGWDNSISTRRTFSDGGYLLFAASFKFDANAEVIFGFTGTTNIDDYSDVIIGFRVANGSQLYAYANNGVMQLLSPLVPETWYDFKIEKTGTTLQYYTRLHDSGPYVLQHTATFVSSRVEYKAAALNLANFYSSSGGYNTKGWSVESVPKTTSLSPGTYTYTITDAGGCTATAVMNVTAGNANSIALHASVINAACNGTANGTVSLSPSGGTTPYSYAFKHTFGDNLIQAGLFEVRNGAFEQNGDLRGNSITNSTYWDNSIATYYTFNDAGTLSAEGSFKFDANANLYFGFVNNASIVNDPSQVQLGFGVNGNQLSAKAGAANISIATITANTWYDLKVEKKDGLIKFYTRLTGTSNPYVLIHAMPYTGTASNFRVAVIMYGSNGAFGGFNTKNWVVNDNPATSGLKAGNYTYKVYDASGCYAATTINMPSNTSGLSVTAQTNNTTAWNICNGSVAFSSQSTGLSYLAKVFNHAFSGTAIDNNLFTLRNGAFTANNALVQGNISNNSGWDNSISTSRSFTDNGYMAADMDMRFGNNTEVYFGLASSSLVLNGNAAMAYAFYYSSGKIYAYTADNGAVLIASVQPGIWSSYRVEKTGSAVNFYMRPEQDNAFQLIYSTTTNAAASGYKVGAVNLFDVQTGVDRSYRSRNWKVYNAASLNNLCSGAYTYIATEPGGCTTEVSFNVNTLLALVQTMTAPANVIVNTNAGNNFATNVNLGSPGFAATPAGITITNNAPAQFPLGTTTVTWTAVDAAGITVTGTQTVTVADNEPPVVVAPADITISLYSGQTIATGVNLGTPVVHDNVAGVTVSNNAPIHFTAGTTVVTWTATDAAGNITTATQNITVVLVPLPGITAPADITVNNNPGLPYASGINLGTPTLGSVVPGVTITNNAPVHFAVGVTTVIWTVSDTAGNSASATQLVTVIDNEAPVIVAPSAMTVNTNTGVDFATIANLGWPSVTDNVAALATNNAPAQFPIGTTTVTWTAMDAAGNTSTAIQLITVTDNEPPAIVAPVAVTVNTDVNSAYASGVILGSAIANDNAAGFTVSNNAPAQFPVGITLVTWMVTDASGNSTTATQTVTVTDNQPPVITAPANVSIMLPWGATYATGVTLGNPVYSDNVPGVNIANNAPLQYPAGTTIITWTATDAAGNTTTATQLVTVQEYICPPIAASLTSTMDSCGTVVTAAGGTVYQWSFGGIIIAQSSTISLGNSSASGIYTVKVWNDCGDSATASYTYTATATASGNNNYSVIGLKWVRLGENNTIHNGGIGVTGYFGVTTLQKNTTVEGNVQSRFIIVQNPVTTGSKIYSPATVTLPAMQVYNGNCNNYSNYTVNTQSPVTLNSNYRNLYIRRGANVTLGGTLFKTVTIEEGAVVRFTAPTINIESLLIGTGLGSGIASVKFANNTSVRISTQVKVEERNIINPDGVSVNFFVGDNSCDEEKFLVKGNGARVNANVYMPNGTLWVQSNCGHGYGCSHSWFANGNNTSHNAACATTYMNGVFIAEAIESGNNVEWTGTAVNNCNNIVVTDTVKPVISCIAAQQFCKSPSGSYSIPVVAATDNSGIVNMSYQATGATQRSGNGNDASGQFNTGTTIITWTATDANGNTSHCAVAVTINPGPAAEISDASSDVFCGDITLTASSQSAGVTFQWLYNNNVVANSTSITLNNGSGQGMYTLAATDASGCTNATAASYQYNAENLLNRYTIVGIQKVSLHEANIVQSGSVGVMSYNGKAEFKKNSSVAGTGAFVKAANIDVQNPVTIPNKIYSPAVIALPSMQVYNGGFTNNDYTVAQNATVTLSGNYRTLTVKRGATVTLTGNSYRTLNIESGAKVSFTSTTLNLENLVMGKGSDNAYTRVYFAGNTSVRISRQVKLEENCQFNPDAKRVDVYVGDMSCDEEKFFVKGNHTAVTANVYVPNGEIKVTGGNLSQCYMTGIFIAEKVSSEGKGVIWNGFNCNNVFRPSYTAASVTPDTKVTEGLKVSAFPNPSASYFTLRLTTKNTGLVTIRVTDISGRLVQIISKQEAATIFKLGDNWMNGVYLLEITQGNKKQTIQLVKAN